MEIRTSALKLPGSLIEIQILKDIFRSFPL